MELTRSTLLHTVEYSQPITFVPSMMLSDHVNIMHPTPVVKLLHVFNGRVLPTAWVQTLYIGGRELL